MDKSIDKIIEYRGFSNLFVCLIKSEGKYYLVWARTKEPIVVYTSDGQVEIGWNNQKMSVSYEKTGSLQVDFTPTNGAIVHLVELQTKSQFYTIVEILREVIGE